MSNFQLQSFFRRNILVFMMTILPSAMWAQDDPLSLEAMIDNHKTVRTVLDVRAIMELGVYEYHKESSKKITDYRKIEDYFRSSIHRAFFVKEMNLVTRASLSQNLLKNLPTLIPPLSEQQAIASYLDEKTSQIDSLIAIKQEKITELKDYKKSIIYEYVTGKKKV